MEKEKQVRQIWTATERQTRINQIKDEMKIKKRMTVADFYKFALTKLQVSFRAINSYMEELETMELFTVDDIYTNCWDYKGGERVRSKTTFRMAHDKDEIVWKGEGS